MDLPPGLEERCRPAHQKLGGVMDSSSLFQFDLLPATKQVFREHEVHIKYTEDGGSTTLDIAVPSLRLAIEAGEPRCSHVHVTYFQRWHVC